MADAGSVGEHPLKSVRLWFGLVALAAVIAFLPSLWAGYLADDFVMLQTVHILHLPAQAFTHTDIGGLSGHPYRPLWVLLSGAINWVSSSAVGHHIVNVVLSAATALFVVILASRLVERGVALLAGFVFALNPRHAEAVAWIAGSTDVFSGFLCLAALVLLGAPAGEKWKLALGVAVGIAAPLAKESAFPIPGLAILLLAATWTSCDPALRRRRVLSLVVLTVGVIGDLIIRTLVLHGLGNDVNYPFSLHRLILVVGSYLLATFSTSQMQVVQHLALLVIPVVLAALFLFGAMRLWQSRVTDRIRLFVVGVVWFAMCLVPLYDNAVSLNTSNGERLLFLPSVGTAFAFASVAAPLLRLGWGRIMAGVVAAAALVTCLWGANDYVVSGHIESRVVDDIVRQVPHGTTVVVLNLPDSYRSARLLGAGFPQAVDRQRPDLTVLVCAPSVVEDNGVPVHIAFTRTPAGLLAQSSSNLPFTTPANGSSIATTGCSYAQAGGRIALGLYTEVSIHLTAAPTDSTYFWFNGVDMLRCQPTTCAGLG